MAEHDFGNRLPKVARSLGQSVTEFKQGMKDPPASPVPNASDGVPDES